MNSDSDERPGGSYSPTVLCVQAMGQEALFAASGVLSTEGSNPDGAIYKSSQVSQGSRGEETPTQLKCFSTYLPGVEVLSTYGISHKKGKTFPIPSRHARTPARLARHARCLPASPRRLPAHGLARPAAAARARGIVLSPSQLLNRDGTKSSI
jgi:hypothetical protein